ncbi:MAG: SusE domain-containing protein [Bacteroidetes bacterium]|nr:SusE domain-containing protein [Bacteroidota bacterium]
MKKIYSILAGSLLLAGTLVSCKKEENRITFEGGTNPVLTANSLTPRVLAIANRDVLSLKLNWTNPDYRFTTGVSSQDVNYLLQIDLEGANFGGAKKYEKVIAKDLSASLTTGELNTALLSMDLPENVAHKLEARVISSLINGTVPLASNVLKMTVTPYLDVVYPVPANLYITGAATPGNWMGGGDPELVTQKFTKISSSEFQINSLNMNANQGFLFVPVYGNWSNKYGFTGAGLGNNPSGDTFKPDGGDFISPGVAGNYRINVSFKTGKYTFTKL